jgi:hypothetical protein
MATSARHKGWLNDAANSRLAAVYNGTEVFDFDADDFAVALATTIASLTVTTTATVSGNLTISSTVTAGADGVGADGEQLTSGGAAAECDWAAAGSMRQFKKILGIRTDEDEVLETVVNTPIYDFKYRSKSEALPGERITNTGDTETVYTGIMADEAPWAMHFNGRILNPISTIGNLMLAIKALNKKVEQLQAQVAQA